MAGIGFVSLIFYRVSPYPDILHPFGALIFDTLTNFGNRCFVIPTKEESEYKILICSILYPDSSLIGMTK
jgi:hypothetical protein